MISTDTSVGGSPRLRREAVRRLDRVIRSTVGCQYDQNCNKGVVRDPAT